MDSAIIGHIVESRGFRDPAAGAAIAAAWLVIVVGAAYLSLARQDARRVLTSNGIARPSR